MSVEHIYKKYFDDVQKTVKYYLGDTVNKEELVLDLSQEVWLKVSRSYENFQNKSNIKTWLYKIAKNTVFDYFRKNNNQQKVTKKNIDETEDESPVIDRYIENEELAHPLVACLDESERKVILLGMFFGLSSQKAGDLIGISAVNFRQKLVRAKQSMQSFNKGECSLVIKGGSCRCSRKKWKRFLLKGRIDKENGYFTQDHLKYSNTLSAAYIGTVLEYLPYFSTKDNEELHKQYFEWSQDKRNKVVTIYSEF